MSRRHRDTHNFEDTYAGLSDEEEDALNELTFGGSVPVGQDFQFGAPSAAPAAAPTINYADAARAKPQTMEIPQMTEDLMKPMADLWGSAPSSQPQQQQQQPQAPGQEAKPISIDELEAQIGGQSSAPGTAPGGPMPFQPFFYPPGFMPPPTGYGVPPQQFQMGQVPPQQFPGFPMDPRMMQGGQFPPVQGGQFMLPMPPQQQQQQGQQQQPVPQQQAPQEQQQHQPPQPPQQQSIQQPQPQHVPQQSAPQQQAKQVSDLSDFPVLGSVEVPKHQQRQVLQSQQQQFQQHTNQQSRQHQYHRQQQHQHHQYGSQHHDNFNDLSEEEKQRVMRRQQKIQRILQFCGIMNPRDKDFVTRIQLSHIVTDDPYNEDFYFQVYRLLKTGNSEVDSNNIAQAYLDFSGHRLGGRYQRADVALQRMQQQVQKAVTVAKRPRTELLAREGALGKISTSSGKMPRKQLEIVKPKLPEISKGGKKAILLQIENIYQEVLNLESAERERKELDTEALWASLKLFDQDENSMNPFIQVLSYEKGLKIFPRVYHFLDRQQKLTLITLIFANLSLIKIISKSSFKNHPNDEIPSDVQKVIELFQMVVLKPIIVFLTHEAVMTEIIGLLTILIEHNNASFLTTSKLGCSLITILLSRAEITKEEQSCSTEDLQHWSNAYDELFSALETKLSLVFPSVKSYDDAYIWQFFATLALSGKLNHQRIIVDEIRDEIFGSMTRAKETDELTKMKIITNLNLFLNVIGLHANGEEIVELK